MNEQTKNLIQKKREQVETLLNEISNLEGTSPYSVIHEYDSGTDAFIIWAEDVPTQEDVEAILKYEFRQDMGERLNWSPVSIKELAGTVADMACSNENIDMPAFKG